MDISLSKCPSQWLAAMLDGAALGAPGGSGSGRQMPRRLNGGTRAIALAASQP